MVTARGRRELARTASWSSVRSGLGWLIGVWIVLTSSSVGVQLQSMQLAPRVAAKDPGALVVMTLVSVGYQGFYTLLSVALVAALLRLTRVPPSTRAVTPAVVATGAFVVVGLASAALLLGGGGDGSESISTRELWVLAASARAVALVALVLALARMAAALDARAPQSEVGAAFAFVLIDTAFPLHRLLTSAAGAQSEIQRGVLLVVQIAFAALLIDLARRVRRAAKSAPPEPAARDLETAIEPEPEPETEPSAVEPDPSAIEPEPRPATASAGVRNLAALLVLFLVALFPCWDALTAATSVGAFSDAVRGAPGTQPPTTALLFAAGAVGAALIVRRLLASSPYGARGVFLLAVLAVLAYALPHTYDVARYRSSMVDAWPVCETGLDHDGNLPIAADIYRGAYDGPRLASGEPCTRAAERRAQHEEMAPRGDFSDGIVQIGSRFPDDRRRVLWGWLALTLIGAAAGVLIFRAAGADDEPVSETSPDDDDDDGPAGLPEESPRGTRKS